MNIKGILLVDKEAGYSSFYLVSLLRRITQVSKIGHAGTLDPFATGVMILLIGKEYTRKSNQLLLTHKKYLATLYLGISTETYDIEGTITSRSNFVPTLEQIQLALLNFSGIIPQIPPMYSAKKIGGKKLCNLARKGITINRAPIQVEVEIQFINYSYPLLDIEIYCSKGTYIRSLAHDIGQFLSCGAHLVKLKRTHSGNFSLDECIPQTFLLEDSFSIFDHLRHL